MIKENTAVNKRTCLYRHFASNQMLLYVGVSLSAVQRLGQHRLSSHWYEKITTITVEWFDTRIEAEQAEYTAIIKENPKHNIRCLRPRAPYKSRPVKKALLSSVMKSYLDEEEKVPLDKINTHIRLKTLVQYTQLSTQQIITLIETQHFPKHETIDNLSLWSITQIDNWMNKHLEGPWKLP